MLPTDALAYGPQRRFDIFRSVNSTLSVINVMHFENRRCNVDDIDHLTTIECYINTMINLRVNFFYSLPLSTLVLRMHCIFVTLKRVTLHFQIEFNLQEVNVTKAILSGSIIITNNNINKWLFVLVVVEIITVTFRGAARKLFGEVRWLKFTIPS
jgi:hypothetical protein